MWYASFLGVTCPSATLTSERRRRRGLIRAAHDGGHFHPPQEKDIRSLYKYRILVLV